MITTILALIALVLGITFGLEADRIDPDYLRRPVTDWELQSRARLERACTVSFIVFFVALMVKLAGWAAS